MAQDELWQLDNVDVSSFVDGPISAQIALSADQVATSTVEDTSVIDTMVEVALQVTATCTDQGQTFALTGTVSEVEDGQPATVIISDTGGNQSSYDVVVNGGQFVIDPLDTTPFIDGNLTADVTVFDIAGNEAITQSDFTLDTTAILSLTIDQTDDSIINAEESSRVNLSGTVENVEDGQTINVTLTDVNGQQLQTSAVVSGETWQINAIDISAFADGEFTAAATVEDLQCNVAQTQATAEIDNIADLSINVSAECTDVGERFTLSGAVTDIEDGDIVTLTLTDSVGATETVTATVIGGMWQTEPLDLTSLADGNVTASAVVSDNAGNEATIAQDFDLDLIAAIDLSIESGGDGILNQKEVGLTTIKGSVSDIENGQTVQITVTDSVGASVTFDTVVENGLWEIDNSDLSALADGELTLTAQSEDTHCNLAVNSITVNKDATPPLIDIDTGVDGIDTFALKFGALTTISGTTDAEDGQVVTLTISDGVTDYTVDASVSGGTWQANGIDITSLDVNRDWTVDAAVSDIAGNANDDALPLIDVPGTARLFEFYLDIFEFASSTASINVPDGDLVFAIDQADLSSITSSGQPLVMQRSADGKQLDFLSVI